MITEEQVERLRKLGFEATVAFHVREDPNDPASPATKPVWAFAAETATHYLAEEDQADQLIADGKPPTRKQVEAESRKIEKAALAEQKAAADDA